MQTKTTNPIDIEKTTIVQQPKIISVTVEPMTRNISSEAIANDIVSRITGKLVNVPDLYDPKTGKFLSEDELQRKGAVFVSIYANSNQAKYMLKKFRSTGLANPYTAIYKKSAYQVITNIDWRKYINSRNEGKRDFIPQEQRANGIENYVNGCQAVGITKNGLYYTLNGVAFKTLSETTYTDEMGNLIPNEIAEDLLPKVSEASKQREADKHGLEVANDPQYRSPRIDNCEKIACFGFNYFPLEQKA